MTLEPYITAIAHACHETLTCHTIWHVKYSDCIS